MGMFLTDAVQSARAAFTVTAVILMSAVLRVMMGEAKLSSTGITMPQVSQRAGTVQGAVRATAAGLTAQEGMRPALPLWTGQCKTGRTAIKAAEAGKEEVFHGNF